MQHTSPQTTTGRPDTTLTGGADTTPGRPDTTTGGADSTSGRPAAASATTAPTATDTAPGVQLVHDLVVHVPGFQDAYDRHVFGQGGVLPHVFFWDVVQSTVGSYLAEEAEPDWRRTLAFLEERCCRGDTGVDEVIVTSFLGDLPAPQEPGHGIVGHLGPVMAERFERMRPLG
ncbi:hypothetical protein ACWENA_17100 [Streptomyces sp. NPDC004779]